MKNRLLLLLLVVSSTVYGYFIGVNADVTIRVFVSLIWTISLFHVGDLIKK